MKISVSFLSSKYGLKTTIDKIENTNADYIHIDFMDGKFVENKSLTFNELKKYLNNVKKTLDVHLMVSNPLKYISDFATLNTEYIIFHYEAVKDVKKMIEYIKNIGIKVGMSIKPETEIDDIKEYLPYLDQVLIMSVPPGKGGQEFIPSSVDKIEKLYSIKIENNYKYIISIDGGINEETSILCKEKGIDMFVVGSFICKFDDYQKQIDLIK